MKITSEWWFDNYRSPNSTRRYGKIHRVISQEVYVMCRDRPRTVVRSKARVEVRCPTKDGKHQNRLVFGVES